MSSNSSSAHDDRDQFLSVLAHELRNPLAPLRSGLHILRMAPDDPKTVNETIEMMERQMQRMVSLIDNLLDASRIHSGQIDLQMETVDLIGVIRRSLADNEERMERAGHRVNASLPSWPVFVEGDARRLGQVFTHLLDNAAKYSGRDGVVEISVEEKGDAVEIAVIDHGMGISADLLPYVFQLFARAGRSLDKAQDGLGIGLATVRGLVELHGGTVLARSDGPGAGSQFIVRLPVILARAESTGAPAARNAQAERKSGDARRILVVDDNEDVTFSLCRMLQVLGFETKAAADGMDALRCGAAFLPDVVLLDLGMPKLDGYDVCRVIREQSWGKNILIVALTGWAEDEGRSRDAGFDHHLVKPVDLEALKKVLGESVRLSGVSPA